MSTSKPTLESVCLQCLSYCSSCCLPESYAKKKQGAYNVHQPVKKLSKEFNFPQEEMRKSHPPSRKPPPHRGKAVTLQPSSKTGPPVWGSPSSLKEWPLYRAGRSTATSKSLSESLDLSFLRRSAPTSKATMPQGDPTTPVGGSLREMPLYRRPGPPTTSTTTRRTSTPLGGSSEPVGRPPGPPTTTTTTRKTSTSLGDSKPVGASLPLHIPPGPPTTTTTTRKTSISQDPLEGLDVTKSLPLYGFGPPLAVGGPSTPDPPRTPLGRHSMSLNLQRPGRSRSIDEGRRDKPWRVLSSPARSPTRAARKSTLNVPGYLSAATAGGASDSEKGGVGFKLRRALSQEVRGKAPSQSALAPKRKSIGSDHESGHESPVFKWNRSKSTTSRPSKTIFRSGDFSMSVTCATPTSDLGKKAVGSSHAQKKEAILEFSLYYDVSKQSLVVHMLRGLYLPQRRGLKSINSFIQAKLVPSESQVLKTRVVSNSRSPAYDQLLEFGELTYDQFEQQTLVLEVFYRESEMSNRHVSTCYTQLGDLNLNTDNHITKAINQGVDTQDSQVSQEHLFFISSVARGFICFGGRGGPILCPPIIRVLYKGWGKPPQADMSSS